MPHQNLCKIFKDPRILIAKECKKLSKMSAEIEVDESYFGGVRGKRGRGAGKKTPVFLLRATRLVTASRRYAKTQRLCLYASGKTMLCQRVAADYKGLFRA